MKKDWAKLNRLNVDVIIIIFFCLYNLTISLYLATKPISHLYISLDTTLELFENFHFFYLVMDFQL